MKQSERTRAEAITKLHEWLKPGDTVYTTLRHVSRSGMRREIGVILLESIDGVSCPRHPNYATAEAIGATTNKRGDGVIASGCGMDMGFHIVYNLASALWPHGHPCTGTRCPSNDHSNGDRDYTPGRIHKDGGYALRQQWL